MKNRRRPGGPDRLLGDDLRLYNAYSSNRHSTSYRHFRDKLRTASVLKFKRDAVRKPRTPFGVRFFGLLGTRGGSLSSLTPGYTPSTPPACEYSPEGW